MRLASCRLDHRFASASAADFRAMKKLLLSLTLALATGFAAAADRPYNPDADAKSDIRAALAQAAAAKQPVLLIFGANWCEDCQALDHALKTGRNAELISRDFKVVKIDVGHFDHNADVTTAYGNPTSHGIPSAMIVSPDNRILFATRAGELADARRMSDDGIYEFFTKAAAEAGAPAAK
jgi:thioredoxin 1